MYRRVILNKLILVAMAGLLALTACSSTENGPPRASTSAEQQRPAQLDRLRISNGPGKWGYPSPFTYVAGPGLTRATLIFDTLIWKDSTGSFIPWLAKEWTRSPDGTEYRFTLRDNVRWHDGQPLTADDVAFTFDYLRTNAAQLGSSLIHLQGLDSVSEVVAQGPDVVVFRLPRAYAPFEDWIAGRMLIIPKHVWSGVTDPVKFDPKQAVIGSGPYKLESYDPATGAYAFTANDSFFLGTPYVRRLELVPTTDELAALDRGEVSIASPPEGSPPQALAAFEKRFGKVAGPGEANFVLQFNLTKGFPYNNKQFRQALAYAIDRKDMVNRVLLGQGEPASLGGMAPSQPFTPPNLPTYDRDLPKAKALLDQIGLKDADGDGVRDLPDGSPFTPEMQNSTAHPPKTSELIKEYLRDVGIDLRIRSLDPPAQLAASAAGRYDMMLHSYGAEGGDVDWLRIRLSSRGSDKTHAKIYGYDNAQFEELAAAQLVATDPVQRKRLAGDMEKIVAEDLPIISLYVPNRVYFYDKQAFGEWYLTPGGVWGAYPGPENKHLFVTGKKAGF